MKGLSVLFQWTICLMVIYWLLNHTHKQISFFAVKSPLGHVKDLFFEIIKPNIERNAVAVPETFMTTVEIIRNRGYPVEVHHVTTEDGYILELHRIPFGRSRDGFVKGNGTRLGRPVFLQHGMMATDHFWLFNPSNSSLAYILADHGYDVWLGNSRGNTYSRKHVKWNADEDAEYWNYSWDEMGRYDIPASIDYVRNITGQSKLAGYFGYSLGCSVFYIAAIEEPKMNDKVDVMIGFGPTVSVASLNNFFRHIAPYVKSYQFLQDLFGVTSVHTNDGLLHTLLRFVCETNLARAKMCSHVLYQIFGYSEEYNQDEVVKQQIFTIAGHYPGGGSVNTMVHLLQNHNSGERFNYFDYGPSGNMERYGTPEAAEYNLTKVTVPVYLFSAENDVFAPPKDVSWLASQLGNVKGVIKVKNPFFSHGDFVWSPKLAELVNLPALEFLPPPSDQEAVSSQNLI